MKTSFLISLQKSHKIIHTNYTKMFLILFNTVYEQIHLTNDFHSDS